MFSGQGQQQHAAEQELCRCVCSALKGSGCWEGWMAGGR